MSVRTCTQCSAQADDDQLRFCTSCGSPLPELGAALADPVTAPVADVIPADPQSASTIVVAAPEAAIVLPTPTFAPHVAPPAPVDAPEVSIIRRTASRVFLPPRLETEEDTPMISRAWAGQASRKGKKQLGGERKAAGDLPKWEPMPPGELVVTRTKRK